MSNSVPPTKIKFDYIKSNQFRSIHADGIWGGLNGHLNIVMAFFGERPAIPQQLVFPIDGEGLGPELQDQRVIRDAVIRDVEVAVSMNVAVAKSLREWIDKQIEA